MMIIAYCKVYLRLNWANSLKDKRSVVRSIIDKAKSRFNISIAEVGDNDVLNSIIIGFACVSNESSHAQAIVHNVLRFIEERGEAELTSYDSDIVNSF